jgi:multicomponent Na+:H+ antiporter subunit E
MNMANSDTAASGAEVRREKPSAFNQLKKYLPGFVLTFIISFFTWIILSGRFDLFHIMLGVVSCLTIAFFSCDILFPEVIVKRLPGQWYRFIKYLPWILYQVFLANIHIMRLVFHPRMMELIDPQIITFKSRLKDQMSLFIFANSITLTPGTITVYVSIYGDFTVHTIDKHSGSSLPGQMEENVANIIGG